MVGPIHQYITLIIYKPKQTCRNECVLIPLSMAAQLQCFGAYISHTRHILCLFKEFYFIICQHKV